MVKKQVTILIMSCLNFNYSVGDSLLSLNAPLKRELFPLFIRASNLISIFGYIIVHVFSLSMYLIT